MSILSNSAIIGLLGAPEAAGGGYEIEKSVRFNSSDSAYLSRTPASAGNRKTWTWAGWVKRGLLNNNTTYQVIFSAGTGDPPRDDFYFDSDVEDTLSFYSSGGLYGVGTLAFRTNAVFRDPSAWYHIVLVLDTPNATSTDRLRLYVNGLRQTFSTYVAPTQNADSLLNSSTDHAIGREEGQNNEYLDAYLADIHFIDGQALDPTSFGEFDDNGIWQPKAYTGTYGTNGFHLPFDDNSTAAALGTDTSGNSNTWTVNNISVAAGAGNDSLVDVPTNGAETDTGVGGEVRGNYFTGNPLDNGGLAFANGNLDLSTTSSTDLTVRGTIGITSGKWYWEVTATNLVTNPFDKISVVGITTANSVLPSYVGSNATSWGYVNHTGQKVTNGSGSPYGDTWVTNDVIGISFDADNGKLFFAKNNTWQGSGDPVAGTNAAFTGLTSGPYLPAFNLKTSGASLTINAGSRPFAYTAPSGFKALCTANLASTTITTSGSYTGNGVADGPFVYLNGVPTAMTVGGNSVTFGTDADKLSNGFKIRTTSTTYNQNANTYNYTITSTGAPFKKARAQPNP